MLTTPAKQAWTVALAISLTGCARSPAPAPRAPSPPPPSSITQPLAPRPSDQAIAEIPQPQLVPVTLRFGSEEVIVEGARLHRLENGRVLLAAGHALVALPATGPAEKLDPVVAAVRSALGDFGTIGGTWPGALYIESFRLGRPGQDPLATSFLVRGDQNSAKVARRVTGSYWLPPMRWQGGGLLTVRADGYSSVFGTQVERSARFEAIEPGNSGTRVALPRFPKDALFADSFVAYPTGRVFALGGRRSRPVIEAEASEYEQERGYMLDGAQVFQTASAGGELRPIQLPGTRGRDRLHDGQLVAGPTETETLVLGTLEIWRDRQSTLQPYLARLGAGGWRRLATELPIRRAQIASDGSAWAIRGNDVSREDGPSYLERMQLTQAGGIDFQRVLLTATSAETPQQRCVQLRPRELAVLPADEVWLTAHCLDERGATATLLLHMQPSGPRAKQ